MDSVPQVVITGLGAICASGTNPQHIFDELVVGNTAIAEISDWEIANWPCRMGGTVKQTSKELISDRKLHKLIKQTDLFGIFVAEQALASAGITEYRETLTEEANIIFADKFGIYVGTSGATYDMLHDFFELISFSNGDTRLFGSKLDESIKPMWLLCNLPNNVLCYVGIRNNLKGSNTCIANQGTSGSLAIIEAFESIRDGEADRIVSIAHDDPLEPQNILYYQKLGLLSESSLSPFQANRTGSLLGQGGAAIVLETLEAASARNADIHAEILGKGCTSEAQGLLPVRADGDGIARAIALALAQADLDSQQIGMIVCHGNGTVASDLSEAAAIRSIFGANHPPITCFKWAFGHTIAASGCIDMVLAVIALRRKVVPPIASLTSIDPCLRDLSFALTPVKPTSNIALIISRGFGGQNCAMIIRGCP